MNDKYLMAVVRIPVRVTSDGNLSLLNEYSKITIEKMDEILTRTNDTIYSKVVDYLENFDVIEEKAKVKEEEEEVKEEEEEVKEEDEEEEKEKEEEEEEEEKEKEEAKPILHEFAYIKKSKKPRNTTFRARFKSQNFTKKVYIY
jgi:chemotaxis protein histidine kinase CheA